LPDSGINYFDSDLPNLIALYHLYDNVNIVNDMMQLNLFQIKFGD